MAASMNGKEPALRPPFRDWGLSTSFAALHRDPAPRHAQRSPRRAGPSAAMARRAVRLPIPSGRAEEHSFRRIRAARCLSRQASLRGPRLKRAPQVAPKGSRTAGSPFLWRLSFGDAKEQLLRRRAHIPAPALGKGMPSFQPTPRQTLCPPHKRHPSKPAAHVRPETSSPPGHFRHPLTPTQQRNPPRPSMGGFHQGFR